MILSPIPSKTLSACDKGADFETQTQRVLRAFSEPRTMFEASRMAKVERANVCRLIAKWKDSGKIHFTGRGICSVSGHFACRYCTKLSNE